MDSAATEPARATRATGGRPVTSASAKAKAELHALDMANA